MNFYQKYGKRIFDVIVTLFALIPLSIIIGILYIAIWLGIGRPVFFRQKRLGHHGISFDILKFRTMTDERDQDDMLLPDDQRITKLGHLLRNLSLDELPNLFLILKGDMSLVGPRPLPAIYKDRYTPEQMRRHSVIPGLTGWAQVNGRNGISWERKFQLDVWYVENQSWRLDLKILLLTVKAVFSRDGISQDGYVSASEFKGTMPSLSIVPNVSMEK